MAERAVEIGADMLVIHHPLLMRGVNTVAADTPKGKVIHTLIRGGVALFAAHTNADSARPGVNDKLAELIGITPGRGVPGPKIIDKWGVQVPADALADVKAAIFAAGAGAIGDYSECAFQFEGEGQFTPRDGANPHTGEVGEPYSSAEMRVEFVAPSSRRAGIIDKLRSMHPYEEPAFDVVEMAPTNDLDNAFGLGRVGELDEPMSLQDSCSR